MKPETIAEGPPLPAHLDPLPVLLTFGEAVELVEFWNVGGRHYLEDLREAGILVSVNGFPKGKRARYRSAVVRGLMDEVRIASD